MSNKWGVKPEQANVLTEIENIIGRSVPVTKDFKNEDVCVQVKKENVFKLKLIDCELTSVPKSLNDLKSLKVLYIAKNSFTYLPDSITGLKSLQKLFLGRNRFTSLPESIGNLQSLQELNISFNQLNSLPKSIGNLTLLQELNASLNQISSLPESIGNLKLLEKLDLTSNKLTSLPEEIENLVSLHLLFLGRNEFTSFPKVIIKLVSLEELWLSFNKINSLPESIANLKSLQKLIISQSKITSLPLAITRLSSLLSLGLSSNKLTTLPISLTRLVSLQKLNLSYNKFTFVPKPITKLTTLVTLDLMGNQLKFIPDSIEDLQNLTKLDLGHNQLTTIPETLGNLRALQKLDLSYNFLGSLPKSIYQLNKLEVIRLENNEWEGEWKEISHRDAISIRNFCRQRATISIFISHTVKEFTVYRIKELARFLRQQNEIEMVYYCEENLKGNIDMWIEETVPKSHLLLFVGTQSSLVSKDCNEELRLARINKIPRIPILGLDINWQELAEIGLSRELGFEFIDRKFDKLCKDLYKYICTFKRERDLLSKEQASIHDNKLRMITIIKESITSVAFNKAFSKNSLEIKSLEKEFISKKISFQEFLKRLGDLLK